MCLDTLKPIPTKLKKEHGHYIGWKYYRSFNKETKCFEPEWQGKPQPIGTWMHEIKYRNKERIPRQRIRTSDRGLYTRGFHIYLEPRNDVDYCYEGQDYHTRKVYFEDIVAFGLQGWREVVVAKKMRILYRKKRPIKRSKNK